MTPGGNFSAFKVCPECSLQAELATPKCMRCGHTYRQSFAQPGAPGMPQGTPQGTPPGAPYGSMPPNATQAFRSQGINAGGAPGINYMGPADLGEMARQFMESRKLFMITFWIGLFCLWPVWIVTYLEYTKMRSIKEQVGRMGVDVSWWQVTDGARDAF